jgi:paraquat-inducible protein B
MGALAVMSAALLIFGGHSPIGSRRRLVVYFNESVAGLERGSAVKVRGVHGGRVSSMAPFMDPGTGAAVVAVVCDMRKGALTRAGGAPLDLGDRATVERLVAQGLRARLEPTGLSGEYSVALDFYDPKQYPASPPPAWAGALQPYPCVPSVRSLGGQLIDDLGAVMRGLRRADLEGITKQLGDGELRKTLRQIGDAAVSVKNLADYLERNPSAVISGKKAPERK